jgi:hypothetical protein
MKVFYPILLSFILLSCGRQNYAAVPDEKTAIVLADSAFVAEFGNVDRYKPFQASQEENRTVWHVRGQRRIPEAGGDTIIFQKGGGIHAEIRKRDGYVIGVYKTK